MTPAPHASSAVIVRGLSKSYGQLHAVRDLDLDVAYGEIFAILGPNGAGKSTTIEILEGHRKRDAGSVCVLGEDPGTAGRSWRAKVGIVLQEVSDAGMLTVSETVHMFANCYGKARVPEEVLELVGLGSVCGSKVRTLSGGQRRRLDEHDLHHAVRALTVPLLIMHAEGDEQVPVEHSRELAGATRHPGSRLIAVPGGHHRSIQHDEELQAVSLRFITRALGAHGN